MDAANPALAGKLKEKKMNNKILLTLLVFSLCVAATALSYWEDYAPPWFSCYCENSAFVSWFTSSSPLNPSDQPECYEYNPQMDPEQNQNFGFRYYDDAFKWLGAYEGRWSVMALWVDGEEALVMPLPVRPENPGDKPFLTLYVQCIFHSDELGPEDMEIDLEIWNSPDYEQSPETIGQYVGGDFPELVEVWDLENGWCLAAYSATFSPEDYPGIWDATHSHVFLVGLENVYFDDILVDMLWHEEPQPPDSCYSPPPPTSFVSNPKPQYGQEHMRCDVNEICFQEPFIASFGFGCRCGKWVGRWRSILEGPFDLNIFFGPNDTNLQLIESLTDFNSPNETCVDIGPTLPGTTYYWRVDINDYNSLLSCEGFIYPFTTWGFAMNPEPADGAESVDPNIILKWKNDGYAASYDAYLYDDNNVVIDANFGLTIDQNSWNPFPDLAFDKSYLWRVDECNTAGCFEGEKWNFITGLCETMEDFESYTDSSDLRATWKDSLSASQVTNGAVANLITTGDGLVYQDSQSMKVNFDRSDFTTPSDDFVERSYSHTQDLTFGGGKSINIAYRSDDVNAPEPGNDSIYMQLLDIDANSAKVYYTGQVNDPCWAVWYIALSEISDAGADPCDINNIRIGAEGSTNGNNFCIYVDLLTRCAPICRTDSSSLHPLADFTGPDGFADCIVDEWDLMAMADEWLSYDYYVYPTEPCDANLLVEYLYDTNLTDTSLNNYHGRGINEPNVHDGILTLNGTNWVEITDLNEVNPFEGSYSFSIAMDFKTQHNGILLSSAKEPWKGACLKSEPGYPDDCNIPTYSYHDSHSMAFFISYTELIAYCNVFVDCVTTEYVPDNFWHTVVKTYDRNSQEHLIYLDGLPGESSFFNPEIPDANDDSILIGSCLSSDYPYYGYADNFEGDLDNVRIYNYPLSQAEAMYLTYKTTEPVSVSVDDAVNIYVDGPFGSNIINFKDYSILADEWLQQKLWPDD
jgi:hypothetical protein